MIFQCVISTVVLVERRGANDDDRGYEDGVSPPQRRRPRFVRNICFDSNHRRSDVAINGLIVILTFISS